MDMSKLQQMLGQAQQMQAGMEQKMEETVAEGTSGGRMVTARMNGRKQLLRIKLDPAVVNPSDLEILEDLIVAAVNDAASKIDAQLQSASNDMLGGLDLGGLLG